MVISSQNCRNTCTIVLEWYSTDIHQNMHLILKWNDNGIAGQGKRQNKLPSFLPSEKWPVEASKLSMFEDCAEQWGYPALWRDCAWILGRWSSPRWSTLKWSTWQTPMRSTSQTFQWWRGWRRQDSDSSEPPVTNEIRG